MNVMSPWVPTWQRGPLCSRKWSMSSLRPKRGVGIIKGPQCEFMIYRPYILRQSWLTWVCDFGKSKRNLWQHGSCDFGTHSSIYAGDELERLASTATHCLLRQRLPNTRWLTQGAPNQTRTLREWINAAVHTVRSKAGELQILWVNGLPMPSWPKWENWVRELGTKQSV